MKITWTWRPEQRRIGKTVEGRRIEGKRKVTYDDVDGDDLSHGAAGARDGARTTRDECASGEEVGEELSRKERGVISEVSVSERDVSERDARRRCHSHRQPRGTHRGRTGRWSRGREGREPCCWSCRGCLVGGWVRPCRACVAFCCPSLCVSLRLARRHHSNPSDEPFRGRPRGVSPTVRGLVTGL